MSRIIIEECKIGGKYNVSFLILLMTRKRGDSVDQWIRYYDYDDLNGCRYTDYIQVNPTVSV